jgi:hypothetical protein
MGQECVRNMVLCSCMEKTKGGQEVRERLRKLTDPSSRERFSRMEASYICKAIWREQGRQIAEWDQGKRKRTPVVRWPKNETIQQVIKDENRYLLPDGRDAFPAIDILETIADAYRSIRDVKRGEVRKAFFLNMSERLFPIESDTPVLREDVVSRRGIEHGLIYRTEYRNWSIVARISFYPSILLARDVKALAERAGFSIGLGDWNIEDNGRFGRFSVERMGKLEEAGRKKSNGLFKTIKVLSLRLTGETPLIVHKKPPLYPWYPGSMEEEYKTEGVSIVATS